MRKNRAPRQTSPAHGADEPLRPATGTSFPIVGIGASAGGLEAFTELLKHLPLDTGMGFVLVQHLDPQHESVLTQLLARATRLPVREVSHNLRVQPDCVYVIPPNTNLAIASGVLKLEPRPKTRTPHRAIDFFFESLAQDQRDRAIGVILSGTASDGTLGLEAIKAEGGITFAQDESARYDSMPHSAVAAGCVDFVLSPRNIAQELARIAKHPYVAGEPGNLLTPEDDRTSATAHEDDATPLPSGGRGTRHTDAKRVRAEARVGRDKAGLNGFKSILLLLRNHSGVDFSLYKSTTIQRRITRRMVLNRHLTLDQYAASLKGNAKELDALYSDVLISVTNFFRNPEAFDVLKRKVFPKLLQQRGDEPFRVWTLGCSTGQEAYSIAMAFVEVAEKLPRMHKLQVFATDLNEALLEKARHGLYAKSVADDVSPERLRRFFVEEEGGYRISKTLREMVVFARQNLISDPPFSRMDLISCRNLLIYLEPDLQKKALPTFHYALKPQGYLFLGASESIGGFTDLFAPADKKHKIYAKKAAPTPAFHLPVKRERREQSATGQRPSAPHVRGQEQTEAFHAEINVQREADRITVNQFAPPGVLVNADLQILQFRGATSAYLEPPTGKATFDVLKMAREGLMLPLRAAVNKAKKENKTTRKENVRVSQNGTTRTVNVEVIPLKNVRERCFLILFEEARREHAVRGEASGRPNEPRGRAKTAPPGGRRNDAPRVADLRRDLAETRDYLQSIQEQYEAAHEELQASNEEVQSANEELQSVNEELETSKEELESTNEELTTVNEEMANRNAELNRINADLNNLQTSTKLPIVLLGRDLTIRRFSPSAENIFNLRATDLGRSFSAIRHNLAAATGRAVPGASRPAEDAERGGNDAAPWELDDLIRDVIDTVREREQEVRSKEGRWYSLRVRPYMTLDNKVDGAVLVLVDIDELKRSERDEMAARGYAEAILRTAVTPLLVLRADLRINTANEAFYKTFKTTPDQTEGRSFLEACDGAFRLPKLRLLLQDILPRNSFFNDFEVTHDFARIGRRTFMLSARQLDQEEGLPPLIVLAIEDVSERLRADEATARLAAIVQNTDDAIYSKTLAGVVTSWNPGAERMFGYTSAEIVGRNISLLIPSTHADDEQLMHDKLRRGEHITGFETERMRKDGSLVDVSWSASPLTDATGQLTGASVIARDITEQKKANERLRLSEVRFRRVFEAAHDGVLILDPVSRQITEANPFIAKLLGYTSEELLGKELWQIGLLKDEQASHAAFRELQQKREIRYEDLPLQAKSGENREVEVVASAYTEDGKQVIQCNIRDITERKQAEKELHEAMERKNEFLAMLSHELRNPLAPIRNAVQLLRLAGNDAVSVNSASALLERQVDQIVRLVDDLLDVSRISRGKVELRTGLIDLVSVVRHAGEAARTLPSWVDRELIVTLPQPVLLHADAARLTQVVGNLLNNACKFTDKGDRIWLTVEREEQHAVIRVRDTGIGIAADQLPRVFDIFVQGDTSLERSASGLGIGLTLVKTFVELHGGTVEVHSAGLGQGSEFVVRLPILADTLEAPRREPISAAITTGRRILVVDDNRDSADSLVMLLAHAGNEAHVAYDGLEAVNAAATFKPDVVLLDIGLPKLNGYDVCRKIREQPWGKRMVLVALTGWGQEQDRRRSAEAGFDAHLIKPIDLVALSNLLGKMTPPPI